jgi:hypothetical protein
MDGSNAIKDHLLGDSSLPSKAEYDKNYYETGSVTSNDEDYPDGIPDVNIGEIDELPAPAAVADQSDQVNVIAHTKKLFDNWLFYRFIYSVFAVLAIIPAAIDYELSFDNSASRTPDHCTQNEDVSPIWKILTVAMSFMAIVQLIVYRFYLFEWKRYLPKICDELPPMRPLSLLEWINMRKPPKFKDYFGDEVPWTILLLLVNPYPYLEFAFCIDQQMNYQTVETCYFISEVLYAIMYFRVYLLVTGIFNYGKYYNPIAMRIGERHGVRVTSNFAIKCFVNRKSLQMLLFLFLIPAVFVFGLLMRIFERPMRMPNMDFDYAPNAWWNIIITMTTVGYGDTFPYTNIGRLIVAASAFWGGIILSLTFSTMSTFLQLKVNEQKALNSILITSVACDAISSVVSNKRGKVKDVKNLWGKVRERLIVLKEYKQDLLNTDQLSESTANISIRLFELENKTEKIKKLLNDLHDKVDSAFL